ncbi:hypothetical protein [Pedobacter sp. MC2016-24]|uniref:hypothetical protein n=1 Tax=Pedobacter sp. MC2016-24 TaxID=2780090 RepID=UPI0018803D0B|nr:hypothetical protein [Pedobacter sp. MC2016-24]MBE9601125.1 hypothetical protein [Pedobacter sp. MC2016-24]
MNREEDNEKGKVLLTDFYTKISDGDFEKIDKIVSDSLKQIAGPDGLSKLLKSINNKIGRYKSYTIEDHYTRCFTGKKNETDYFYKLKVVYDKGITDEVIRFTKQNNGAEGKINSYHAYSDLLLK